MAKKIETTPNGGNAKRVIRSAKSGRFTLKELENFEKDTSKTSKAIIRSVRATYKSTHGSKRVGRA